MAGALAAALIAAPAEAGICGFEIFHSDYGQIEGEASQSFAPGEQFVVCFRALESGYVSLWDEIPAPGGAMERLAPNVNDRGLGVNASAVAKGARVCFGDGETGYYLFHDPADGEGAGAMRLIFTAREVSQPRAGTFNDVSALGEALGRLGARAAAKALTDEAPEAPRGCAPAPVLRYEYRVQRR